MCFLAIFNVLLILPILTSAECDCTSEGKNYAHLDTFTHANGCAKLQCQDGTIVTTYEACGKELDNKCHRVNEQFKFQGQTYVCAKNSTGGYEIDLAPPATFTCTAEGREYKDLETFKLSDGCNNYQCQDGDVSVTSPEACGKELDGECHYVGSWTSSNGKVYKCEKKVVNGEATYSYTEIRPTPNLTTKCRSYRNLEIFNNREDQCDTRQCQNDNTPFLNKACRYQPQNKKCYSVGERWVFNGKVYECLKVTDDTVRSDRAPQKIRNCTVGSTTYQHLEIFPSGNGCETSQCQSGEVKVIESGCKDVSGQCYNPNYWWKEGTVTLKCIYNDDYGYSIDGIFDDKTDKQDKQDKQVPICETPGKDVIFVLDDSPSVGAENFEKQKEFAAQLTRRFHIGTNKSKAEYLFGAVGFSMRAHTAFDLNTHLSNSPLYQALLSIEYTGAGNHTYLGLERIMVYSLFGEAAGGRNDTKNYVILITDDQSKVKGPTVIAAAWVRVVATIFYVGIGSPINTTEINQYITRNLSNIYNFESFDNLDQVKDELSQKICEAP